MLHAEEEPSHSLVDLGAEASAGEQQPKAALELHVEMPGISSASEAVVDISQRTVSCSDRPQSSPRSRQHVILFNLVSEQRHMPRQNGPSDVCLCMV